KNLAIGLSKLEGFSVNPDFIQTNIVFAKLDESVDINRIASELSEQGITMSPGNPSRFVTHRDISAEDIVTFLQKLENVL
ncbi:low-specificity L-threonine aldolase, partial [Vibrio cyclitrophicus]